MSVKSGSLEASQMTLGELTAVVEDRASVGATLAPGFSEKGGKRWVCGWGRVGVKGRIFS